MSIRYALALLLCAAPLHAQSPALQPAALQADFDVLRHAVEEAHGGYERYSSRADLARRWDHHRTRLDGPLTVPEFAGILSEALTELRDGHARLEFDSVTTRQLPAARVLPLRVRLENDRLLILSIDGAADSPVRPGMELARINGRPAADLARTLAARLPVDGFIETGRRYLVGRLFPQLYWIYVERPDSFVVTARDGSGRESAATLPAVTERERRPFTDAAEAPPGNVALQFLPGGVARLRVRAFGGESFPASLDTAFRSLRDSSTRGLILDLRGNGGGVDQYGAALVSYLVPRPFAYFDRIHVRTIAPSFATWLPRTFESLRTGTVADPAGGFLVTPTLHAGVGEQQPSHPGFAGRLVVLIDGGTFSTAADVAAQLRSRTSAWFIGEETAGAYEGNTSGLNALIVLPNSGLRLRIMMYDYWNAVRPPAQRGRGTIPDEPGFRTVADLLAGRDPILQRAIAVAGGAR